MNDSRDIAPAVSVMAADLEKPAAIIYTHDLLPGSNTFIKSHAEALLNYYPVYAGAHRTQGIDLPAERTYVLNNGTPLGAIREALFRSFGRTGDFKRKLASHRPHIVHAHFGTSGPAGMTLGRALDVPLLVTFHGKDATLTRGTHGMSHRDRELVRNKDRLIDGAGAFIAVSEYIRRRLLEQGYPESKVILHRNGIDLDFFSPAKVPARRPIILFVGRFVEKKGGKYLIEAARELHESGVEFELIMIGNGPLEQELKSAAENASLPCQFVGFLPVAEVRDWLRQSAVVAIPSVIASDGDSEGLPTIQLEAQATATPVAATRHSGIPEGVIEGVTAELVDERDTRSLAQALRTFLESPAKVESFGSAGRRFVAEKFDLKNQVHGLEAIYSELRSRHISR